MDCRLNSKPYPGSFGIGALAVGKRIGIYLVCQAIFRQARRRILLFVLFMLGYLMYCEILVAMSPLLRKQGAHTGHGPSFLFPFMPFLFRMKNQFPTIRAIYIVLTVAKDSPPFLAMLAIR